METLHGLIIKTHPGGEKVCVSIVVSHNIYLLVIQCRELATSSMHVDGIRMGYVMRYEYWVGN